MPKSTIQIPTKKITAGEAPTPDVEHALRHIVDAVREGLPHGFFHIEITGTIGNGKRREIVVVSSMSQKFTFPYNESDR